VALFRLLLVELPMLMLVAVVAGVTMVGVFVAMALAWADCREVRGP
jgi:hypothetical protein